MFFPGRFGAWLLRSVPWKLQLFVESCTKRSRTWLDFGARRFRVKGQASAGAEMGTVLEDASSIFVGAASSF